jgi:L,D-peptidoglycan transpeptidase YkuD (ErfK/YbiS/YcfS/YnhG family)
MDEVGVRLPVGPQMQPILIYADGKLIFNEKEYRCAVGKGGIVTEKIEGDGATPSGCFPIRKVLYRADKFKNQPYTKFPIQAISQEDGWSDDVHLPEYNSHINLPYAGSHEKLWRDDDLYDIVVVLGYNDKPVLPGKGSAIFIHIAREGYPPTEGCIALSKEDLLELLALADTTTQVCTHAT